MRKSLPFGGLFIENSIEISNNKSMKKYQNEITIDFINKEVFLDSKSITIDALKNGEFTQSEYSPN
ncbi:hypothetical protein [Acinetobacter shaoyimingii]|uniref:Uncharacterized protein n=2 Tax=Acinetobacter shaoyimingii TaxID=2715164 RepID=A0A6G8RRD6_9GAMM|nr:hypothetical protein [Acinetobacter shaoyimingii]QIO04471.1 hypothetical protein G8E00_00105 [Acinetobacter shaoyimingii]